MTEPTSHQDICSRILDGRSAAGQPAVSPDGRSIAFTSDRHKRKGELERNGPAFELYTMRTDGTHVRRLTHNRVPDLHPSWQPRR